MKDHRKTGTGDSDPDLTRLLKLLGYITKQFDPDGFDVRFMIGKTELNKCTKTEDMMSALRNARFHADSDFGACLGTHLQAYGVQIDDFRNGKPSIRRSMLRRSQGPPRPITYYVLTNGMWLGSDWYGQEHIKNLTLKLQQAGFPKGQVGIQFISFGNDDEGLQRLQSLDELDKTMNLPLYVSASASTNFVQR